MVKDRQVRVLSTEEVIRMLEFFKVFDVRTTALKMLIPEDVIRYQRRKYRAYNADTINILLSRLRRFGTLLTDDETNLKRQIKCNHLDAKVFLRCECSLCLGEKNTDQILEILTNIKRSDKKLIEQEL